MWVEGWPLQFSELVRVGSRESNVAIVTLWTPVELVQKHLEPGDYAALSNLFSKDVGLNAVVRGCLANTYIRHLIVTGKDLSGSGEALVSLKKNGVDENHTVIGTNAAIDKEIPQEAIELFRKHVDVIDARQVKEFVQVREIIRNISKQEPYAQPQTFPIPKVNPPSTFPAETTGFRIQGKTVGEAWLQILTTVSRFGDLKGSEWKDEQKELLDVVTVVTHEDPMEPAWKDYFPFTRKELDEYYPKVLTPELMSTVRYTYGNRLMDFKGRNQVEVLAERLKRSPSSRRAVAVLWDVERDLDHDEAPCLLLIQGIIQNNTLHLRAYLRSNDMFDAWPRNALALRRLQGILTQKIGCSLGYLTIISASAHIYRRNFKQVQELLSKHPLDKSLTFDLPGKLMQDPRGNILIRLENGKIVVQQQSSEGKVLDEQFCASAREAMDWLVYGQKVSHMQHAMYIGQELEKAELALKHGFSYLQDKPLVPRK